MKKQFFRYDNPLWALFAAFVFLLVFSWTTSPLYMVYGNDSPFFQIIGLGVLHGKVPYVDLFDHKGPLIFFANTLGYSFGLGKTGLFLLQVINLSAALVFFYKIASLVTSSAKRAFYAVALSLIPLVDFIIEGNQCEEWMLPWEAAGIYIVFRYLSGKVEKFRLCDSLWMGIIFSVLFYIRPNDGVMWIGGMYFGLFLLWIVRKNYRAILPSVACFLAGFALVSAAVFPYFIIHNAVYDLFRGMILHNLQYAGDALFTWGGCGMIFIPAIFIAVMCILSAREGHSEYRYVLVPVLVLVILLIGKRDYYHYLLPFVPFMAMCYAMCMEHGWKAFLWVVSILFAIFSFRECKCIVKAIGVRECMEEFYAQTDALFEMVPEEERNSVWNYNLFTLTERHSPHMKSLVGAWLHKGLTPSNAAFVYFQMDYAYPESEYGIQANAPEWVMVQPYGSYDKDLDYIYGNYDLIGSTPSEPVCEIRLYHRR